MSNFASGYIKYINHLEQINDAAISHPARMIQEVEGSYREHLRNIARNITERPVPVRIVMLSGPSSSGKTTTAHLLRDYLGDFGVRAVIISLDDFYLGRDRAPRLPDGSFDLITIAYGLRNFADISAGLAEMLRLLRPGGKLLVLELSRPTSPIPAAFYNIYTATVIPVAGKLVSGDSNAYSYLPRSIAACPARGQMTALMDAAGFVDSSFRSLTMGVCTLYKAFKP